MGEKRKNKDRLCTILMIVFFSILAILVILPIYTIFLASFKPGGDLLQYGLNLGIDWSRMSLDNYVLLFTGQHDYWRWFFNSITLTVVTVVATLLVSAFVGYGFAAYEFKGKSFMFVIVLLILSVPLEVIMLPLYKQMTTWGLMDNYIAIIFFKLIMPIMKPAFAAMAILNGMNAWNNYLWPLLVIRSSEKYTLTLGLNTLINPYGDNYSLLVVGSFFSIIPIFILFVCFQQYFIEGMTAGAVKE